MVLLKNICLYPGVPVYDSATYTDSIGITPGNIVVSVPIVNLGTMPHFGDVTLSDGLTTIVIPDCKLTAPRGQRSGGGQTIDLVFLDHKWRWQFGEISGRYNVVEQRTNTVPLVPIPGRAGGPPIGTPPPIPPGTEPVRPSTKKTARQLAVLCLKAMGEKRYDVSQVPDDTHPNVNWDVDNPAQALQNLVEQFGCVVVWSNFERQVKICKRGEGSQLPGGALLSQAEDLATPAFPSKIRLVGARIHYQQRYLLEAVGRDFDGSLRPLWALSYRPDDNDWTKVFPPHFGNLKSSSLPGNRTRYDAIAAAKASIYRMYRVKTPEGDEKPKLIVPPDSKDKKHKRRGEHIHLLPHLNQTSRDDLNRYEKAPARVLGVHTPIYRFHIGKHPLKRWEETEDDTHVTVPFTISEEAERSYVVFADYVCIKKYAEGTEGSVVEPASLVIECAAEVMNPDTNQFDRYYRDLLLTGGVPTEPAIVIREDLIYEVTAEYNRDPNKPDKVKTNVKDIDRKAQYILLGEAKRYQNQKGDDKAYCGLLRIAIDGAIQQVTWAVGGGSEDNPSTRASRNGEHNLYQPPYEGRRRNEDTNLDARRRMAETMKAMGAAGQAFGTDIIAV